MISEERAEVSRTPAVVREAEWNALAGVLQGELVRPGAPHYDRLRVSAIARFAAVRPQALVRCGATQDVVEALAFARRTRLPFAIRSGGHDFAGRSSSRGLVIDLAPLCAVDVGGGVARVGAGARLATVYAGLAEHDLTLPAGCGATVGIGGLTLGGGLGLLGRRHGLTCDRVRAAEVVLADGRVVRCDEGRHADLFWALRGAGAAGVGVATALHFEPVTDPAMTRFELLWPPERAAAAVAAWQAWAPGAPRGISTELSLTASALRGAAPEVVLAGAAVDADADLDAELERLADLVGGAPASRAIGHGSHSAIKRDLATLASDATGDDGEREGEISRSECFARSLPPHAVAALLRRLDHERTPGQTRRLELLPLGGAYDDVPRDGIAYAHRGQRFVLTHTATVAALAPAEDREGASRWLAASFATTHPWGSGRVYPNFPEPSLEDPARAYWAQHVPRLRRIKARYDPDGLLPSALLRAGSEAGGASLGSDSEA